MSNNTMYILNYIIHNLNRLKGEVCACMGQDLHFLHMARLRIIHAKD